MQRMRTLENKSDGHAWIAPIARMRTPGEDEGKLPFKEGGRLHNNDLQNFTGTRRFWQSPFLLLLFPRTRGEMQKLFLWMQMYYDLEAVKQW